MFRPKIEVISGSDIDSESEGDSSDFSLFGHIQTKITSIRDESLILSSHRAAVEDPHADAEQHTAEKKQERCLIEELD